MSKNCFGRIFLGGGIQHPFKDPKGRGKLAAGEVLRGLQTATAKAEQMEGRELPWQTAGGGRNRLSPEDLAEAYGLWGAHRTPPLPGSSEVCW